MVTRFFLFTIVLGLLALPALNGVGADDDEAKKIEAFNKQMDDVMAGKGAGGKFSGTNTCRACHMATKTGAQFKKWQAGPHAKAFKSLESEEGIKRAKAKGIEKPTEDPNCLKCHSPLTTVAKDFVDDKFKPEEGVGCEVCHGSGEKHAALQKEAMKNKTDAPEEAKTVMLKINEPVLRKALCARCHMEHEWHESKLHEDTEKVWAEIAHPKP